MMIKTASLLGLSASLLVSGCAFQAQPISTSAAAAEVRVDRRVSGDALAAFDSSLSDMSRIITPASYVCSVHRYPITAEDALVDSVRQTLQGVYDSVEVRRDGLIQAGDTGGALHVYQVRVDEFRPRVSFSPGFLTATIDASVETLLRVVVLDAQGNELTRTIASGRGSATASGDCPQGGELLAEAVTESIRRVLEELVYKIVNTGDLAQR